MKKFSLVFSLILILITFSSCGKFENNNKKDEIKIGAVLPLTGDLSALGKSSKNALDMLVEETNENDGIKGKKIKIIYEDDENKPEKSINKLQKLINDEEIVAVIGSITSKCSLAMGPIASKNKVPMITPSSTNTKITREGGDYVYRACFNDEFQGKALSKYIVEDLNMKTASVLYNAEDEYSKGLAESFKHNFEKYGGKILAYEKYSTKEESFDKQLSTVKKFNTDVLFIPDYYNVVNLIAKEINSEKIKSLIIGGDGWDLVDFIDNGLFINHYSLENINPQLVEFKKKYIERYDSLPDACSILSYDALNILLDSIERVENIDSSKINDEIKKSELNLISGKIKYDENGDLVKPAVIIKIENNNKKFIKKINP